jgi:beta-lactamase superfamily II metal-dependent hydrolase
MSQTISFEIDFLPVGNGDRSGDAIAIRYGVPGQYKVLVYDGGTKESGQAMVDHIKKYYGTSRIDFVINSHPDTDHASGLSVILEQMEVGELWMHQPWKYSEVIRKYFHDGRITDNSLMVRLKEKMSAAYALEQIAKSKGVPIYEPFQGAVIGEFTVLSPSRDWYIHELIAEFNKSPKQKSDSVAALVLESLGKATAWITEHWGNETLRDDVQTSSENESSVVLFSRLNEKGILLTGDAGIRALSATVKYAELEGLSLPDSINFIQIPHHGSRNNISSDTLDRIIGLSKETNDGGISKTAFVSASKNSSTHPRKAVINAFIRRGVNVIATQGSVISYPHNMPNREGWISAETMKFSNKVEPWG